MVGLVIPPELKKITPYVRRAEDLDRDKANPESRLVAYYCRQYAVHMGIVLATSKDGKDTLGQLLGSLEVEKPAMDQFTREEASFLCQKFANKIFDNADLPDRSGEATKETAKTFYAAATFLDILQQFYQDDDASEALEDIKKRSKYAKWKSTEILKAIKEGRSPTPGGYADNQDAMDEDDDGDGEDEPKKESQLDPTPKAPAPVTPPIPEEDDDDDDVEDVTPPPAAAKDPAPKDEGTEVELGPPPAYPTDIAPPPAIIPPPVHKPPLTFSPPTVKPVVPTPKKSTGFLGLGGGKKKGNVTKNDFADATELTRFALVALEDKDSELAAEKLERALKILRH